MIYHWITHGNTTKRLSIAYNGTKLNLKDKILSHIITLGLNNLLIIY